MRSNISGKMDLNKISQIIVLGVEHILDRRVKTQEHLYIVDSLKALKLPNLVKKYEIKKLVTTLSEKFAEKIKQAVIEEDKQRTYNLSVLKEKQIEETKSTKNIQSFLGIDNYYQFLTTILPQNLYEKHYIIFDSKYRFREGNTQTKYVWLYSPNKQSRNFAVTTVGSLKNIIAMKMYQPIVPYFAYTNLMDRFSILIEEFSTQATIVSQNNKYHFLGRPVETTGGNANYYELYLLENETFKFHAPVQVVDRFSFVFKDPNTVITFPVDITPATFTYGATTTLDTGSVAHGMTTGHSVYIEDFTTDAPVTDQKTIDRINTKYGLPITRLTDYTFTIPVDTSAITPKAGLSVDIFLGSARIVFAIEFTTIK